MSGDGDTSSCHENSVDDGRGFGTTVGVSAPTVYGGRGGACRIPYLSLLLESGSTLVKTTERSFVKGVCDLLFWGDDIVFIDLYVGR